MLFLSWAAGFSKEVKTVSLSMALLPLGSSDGLNSEKIVLLVQNPVTYLEMSRISTAF